MKKQFRQADGHFVTIEGTPEEIRAYEKILEGESKQQVDKPAKPEVLKGIPKEQAEDFEQRLREIFEKIRKDDEIRAPKPWEPWLTWPPSVTLTSPCASCCYSPCRCSMLSPYNPFMIFY